VSPRRLLEAGSRALLSKEQQEMLSRDHLQSTGSGYLHSFLKTPLGWPFRVTIQRKSQSLVLGSEGGSLGVVIDAITALSALTVLSLEEDVYGKVQTDVPSIIREFSATLLVLEEFGNNPPIHWTDVYYSPREPLIEVYAVERALKDGLRGILASFGGFADGLGVSVKELRVARGLVEVEEKTGEKPVENPVARREPESRIDPASRREREPVREMTEVRE
jgi:nucleoporin NDC1